jgi:membrane fusion protein (multidrug efflux system)
VRISADGVSFTGSITALDPRVEAATRNVRIRATLANTDEKLRTGMSADVEVVLPAGAAVVAIPATAVLYAPYGDSVFVVERKKSEPGAEVITVQQRTVRLGETRGDFVAVVSGLRAGDEIVSTGAFKLRTGAAVRIDNETTPPAELAPKPANT